jgi:hypothetical protein
VLNAVVRLKCLAMLLEQRFGGHYQRRSGDADDAVHFEWRQFVVENDRNRTATDDRQIVSDELHPIG